jgi:hypothetical protein
VFISDENGCLKSSNYFINEPENITLDFLIRGAGNNNNGRVSALVTGGTTPYTYQWSTGESGPVIEDLRTGNYSVTITDKNGCSITGEANIDATTAVESPDTLAHFLVFPNPTKKLVQIEIDFAEQMEGQLILFNNIGQLKDRIDFNVTHLRKSLQLENYTAGTYLLLVKTEKITGVRKIVILP